MAQVFAIMPVNGLRDNNPRFKWFTLSVIYSLCYIVIVYILAYLTGRQIFNGKVNTSNSGNFHSIKTTQANKIELMFIQGGIIFFISIILSFHLFFMMARKWNKLIFYWREKEEIFLHPPYKRHGWHLKWKIRSTAAFFFCLAICNFFLSCIIVI